MSESENYDEVTVASDGITVVKTFEADAFPVPAIAFRISSARTEDVSVRLVDNVPESVAVEDLGFHPEYGSEYWTIDDDVITFEREVESGEQYTTVYGIRATGTDDVEKFLTEPELAEVDPPLEDEDDLVDSSGSDAVRDASSGDTDSVPGLEEDDDEDIGTLDLADPNEPGDASASDSAGATIDAGETADVDTEAVTESAGADADTDVATSGSGSDGEEADDAGRKIESVAAALAAELREGEADEEDVEALQDAIDPDPQGSVEARIERLQTDVSDIRAYTDALEEFLDENGSGQEIIEELRDQVSSVEEEIEGNADALGSLESTVESLESDLETLSDDVADVESGLADLEAELDGIDDLSGEITDLEEEVTEIREWRDQLTNVLGAAGGD